MTRPSEASLEFLQESIASKLATGDDVIAGLTAQASLFPSPDVIPAALQDLQDDLRAKATAAAGGDHAAIQVMYLSEKTWDAGFKKDALYVSKIANGAEAIVLLSGFKSTKTETHPNVRPAALEGMHTKSTAPGHINVECLPVHHAGSFTFIVYLKGSAFAHAVVNDQLVISNPAGLLSVKTDTHRKTGFESITPRVDVSVIGFAVNSAGMGPVTQFPDVFVL